MDWGHLAARFSSPSRMACLWKRDASTPYHLPPESNHTVNLLLTKARGHGLGAPCRQIYQASSLVADKLSTVRQKRFSQDTVPRSQLQMSHRGATYILMHHSGLRTQEKRRNIFIVNSIIRKFIKINLCFLSENRLNSTFLEVPQIGITKGFV